MQVTTDMLYWVMQADEFKTLIYTTVSLVGISIPVSAFVVFLVSYHNNKFSVECAKIVGVLTAVLMVLLTLNSFVPSTKSLAVMYILPNLLQKKTDTLDANSMKLIDIVEKELNKDALK